MAPSLSTVIEIYGKVSKAGGADKKPKGLLNFFDQAPIGLVAHSCPGKKGVTL
jgi:hypothetical protein